MQYSYHQASYAAAPVRPRSIDETYYACTSPDDMGPMYNTAPRYEQRQSKNRSSHREEDLAPSSRRRSSHGEEDLTHGSNGQAKPKRQSQGEESGYGEEWNRQVSDGLARDQFQANGHLIRRGDVANGGTYCENVSRNGSRQLNGSQFRGSSTGGNGCIWEGNWAVGTSRQVNGHVYHDLNPPVRGYGAEAVQRNGHVYGESDDENNPEQVRKGYIF